MAFLAVLVAGIAGFIFGAAWYTVLAKPWIVASGVALDAHGQPANRKDPAPYITSIFGAILVAGMMRHVFALGGIDTLGAGIIAGLGIGLFLVSPWIATFNGFGGRPFRLTLINGGYATFGCAVIAAVLMLSTEKGF